MKRRAIREIKRKDNFYKKSEKGLSTIVATLLMILLVLVAIGIVWLVVRNVIQNDAEQASIGKFTLNLEIKSVSRDVSDNSMNVKIRRNPGEGELSGISFIANNGNSTEIINVENITLNPLEQGTYDIKLNSSMNVSNLEILSIAPIFLTDSGKEVIGNVADEYLFFTSNNSEIGEASCLDTCSNLGYVCGTQNICGSNINCGSCLGEQICGLNGECVPIIYMETCGTLSVAGTTYILNSSVTSTGTCFDIAAENITLDCNNSWINYSTGGGANTYGIVTNQFNSVIKNCNIIDGNWASTQTTRHGIYLNSANNSIVYNNFINISNGNGIRLYNSARFNSIASNIAKSNSNYGISLRTYSNNNVLTNNQGVSTSGIGMEVVQSSNNSLVGNIVTSDTGTAIYIYSSSNNILTGNRGTSSIGTGIYAAQTSNSNLTDNTGISFATGRGIDISGSLNILTGNNGTSNSGIGISASSFSNNILMDNTGTSLGSASGILIYSNSNNNTLTGNIGTSNRDNGLSLVTASNNVLIKNIGISNTGSGIYIETSSNNVFMDNNGTSNSLHGVYLLKALNNNFVNQIVRGSDGVFFRDSNNTIFRDCINIDGTLYESDVYYYGNGMSINNTFINCSYDGENLRVLGTELIRKWYYKAQVKDGSGNAINTAGVSAFNNLNALQFTGLTDSSGWIERQEVIEYVNTGGIKNYYSNYNITVSKEGYNAGTHTFDFTAQKNKIDDLFVL